MNLAILLFVPIPRGICAARLMKELEMIRHSRSIVALAAAAFGLGITHSAHAQTAFALANNGGTLVSFNLATPGTVTTIGNLSGAATSVSDIDFRVANGLLYGYSQTVNQIVTIDTTSGVTTFVSTPSTASNSNNTGIDFNPAADRLRIVNSRDQNLRVNVATGATTVDGALAYAPGDPNVGVNPNIIDVAYTNNDNNPNTDTTLYYIDFVTDTLVSTSNPNGGTLNTVGALGVNQSNQFGFDIFTDAGGGNSAYAILDNPAGGAGLYNINLGTGAAGFIGNINAPLDIFGLAITPLAPAPVPEPGSVALLVGICVTGAGFVRKRRSLR